MCEGGEGGGGGEGRSEGAWRGGGGVLACLRASLFGCLIT